MFFILPFSLGRLNAQPNNNIAIGWQINHYSDWKSYHVNNDNMESYLPFLKGLPLYVSYLYTFRNNIFYLLEVSSNSSHISQKCASCPLPLSIPEIRGTVNLDNNIGYQLHLDKPYSTSVYFSIGNSIRKRTEVFSLYALGFHDLTSTYESNDIGFNLKIYIIRELIHGLNIGVATSTHLYTKGPSELSYGFHIGYAFNDKPKLLQVALDTLAFSRVTIGLESHYFPSWNENGKYITDSHIPVVGYSQWSFQYLHGFKNHIVYSWELSSSSYGNCSYFHSTISPIFKYLFNLENNLGYEFYSKRLPSFFCDLTPGISLRRRHELNQYYDDVYWDIGGNFKVTLDKRWNKHFIIGLTSIFRLYNKGSSDFAYGGHIGYQFGYQNKK